MSEKMARRISYSFALKGFHPIVYHSSIANIIPALVTFHSGWIQKPVRRLDKVTQLLPGSGSSAGGSGNFSLCTYELQPWGTSKLNVSAMSVVLSPFSPPSALMLAQALSVSSSGM